VAFGIDDSDDKPRATRLRAVPLAKKSADDVRREPPPLRRDIEPDDGSGYSVLTGEGATNVHIDAATGAAVIEGPSATIIDFSGRDSQAEQAAAPAFEGFDENLALRPDVPLATIAANLIEEIDAAIADRRDWEDVLAKGMDILGIKWEEASIQISDQGTISKAHDPLLLDAGIRSWANSRAELLPAAGPIKVRDDKPVLPADGPPAVAGGAAGGIAGADPHGPSAPPTESGLGDAALPPPVGDVSEPGVRDELANALAKDMNHYLTVVDREYYPDFSKMLLSRAFKGSQFRKVYFDPLLRRPVSRWVKGTDLIISNDASHPAGASLIAEQSLVRKSVVKRMQKLGVWRMCNFDGEPTQQPTPTEQKEAEVEGVKATPTLPRKGRYRIYECYVELDDGPLGRDENGEDTGLALPYKVTLERESRQIVEIRRHWKEGDRLYRTRRRYVHYGMLPSFGMYHWGYFHVLGSPQRAATALLREFTDAEMLASFPGGVMGKQPGTPVRQRVNDIRPGLGQFEVIDTGGLPIDQFVLPWPYKGASPQLPVVLDKVVSDARRLAGAVELPVGEGRVGNVPVGTVLAFIDQISKVPSAIHKDDHIAQQEEYELLKELLAEHPECLESPSGRQWTAAELNDTKLVPASDPNTPSMVHRIMKVAATVELANQPLFMAEHIPNARGLWQAALGVLGWEDKDQLTNPPPPPGAQAPPDPRAMAAMAKMANEQQKNQIEAAKLSQKAQETQREAASASVEAEQRAQDRASEERIEQERQATERMRLAAEQARARTEMKLSHHAEQAQHHDKMSLEHRKLDEQGRQADQAAAQRQAKDENDNGNSGLGQ